VRPGSPGHVSAAPPFRLSAAVCLLALVALGGANPAGAQYSGWLPRLRLDNDAYNFWKHPARRPDEEYTNGVVASVEALRGPWWGRRLGGGHPDCARAPAGDGRCLTTQLAIGQDIYTPNLDRPPFSSPDWEDERPYAAWLWLGASGRIVSTRSLRVLDVAVGVTGPPALGQLSQRIAHVINRRYTTKATGWETQVGSEPGLQLGVRESLLAGRVELGGKGFLDFTPAAGVSLGSIRTAADVGGRARVGYNLSHPWDVRAWRGRTPLEFFASLGGRIEYVARDFSLDGTLLSDGRRVERIPVVREYEVGLGLRMHRLGLGWRATTRTREYETGPRFHPFSTMYASWEFLP
jgi:hypothetical protein